MPTERAYALQAVGLFGKFNQRPGQYSPFWYGKVVAVHSSGDYLQLETGGSRRRATWAHRRDVHLHETQPQPAERIHSNPTIDRYPDNG